LDSQKATHGNKHSMKVKDHGIVSYEQTKFGLTYFYAKREVLGDGIHTKSLNILFKLLSGINHFYELKYQQKSI